MAYELDALALDRAMRFALELPPGEHPHIEMHALTPATVALVGRLIHQSLLYGESRGRPKTDENYVYLHVLDTFGIDCPHTKRAAFQPIVPGAPAPDGYECLICGSWIFMVKDDVAA